MRVLIAAVAACAVFGLTLPTHFASSMVLQRNAPITLWGRDAPAALVDVVAFGVPLPRATADASGRFAVTLPAMPANATPGTISLTSSASSGVVLSDVIIGDVFVCSGQSNMGIPLSWAVDYTAVLARAGALGPTLRLLQVATLDSYTNATTPADNFTASIPWSRASAASAAPMSALCYLIGEHAVLNHPNIPIGLIANPWGGVAIQVYMSPSALAQCAAAPEVPAAPAAARAVAAAEAAVAARLGSAASPTIPSCLYNSMMHPLLSIPVTAFVWLQGEANSQAPQSYQCLQRAMIEDFRASWNAVAAPTVAFLYVQLACWPTGATTNFLSVFREAQAQMVAQIPRAGMVVSCDLCDPAGSFHPIHPPWKNEVARRAWLWLDNEIYANSSSPKAGPAVISIHWDAWNSNWGDFHFGTGQGSYVCGSGGQFVCGGLRLTFDRPVATRGFFAPPAAGTTENVYGFITGAASGFTLAQGDWAQPVVLTSISPDGLTAQLNLTWINPASGAAGPVGGTLFYAWGDYPAAMPLVDASGLPVAPFNLTVPFPPRALAGNCTTHANTDGTSGGFVVAGSSPAECCALCWADARCVAAAFDTAAPSACYMKFTNDTAPKAGVLFVALDV